MRAKPLILDVDDDEAGRYAVSRQLRQAGYEVVGASDGKRGLELAQTERPDLILLDVRLPDIDGFEVCRRIRENPAIAETPIVQMSASYIDTSSRIKGLENGADAYLTEPVEPGILLATMNSLLRMKRAEQKVQQGALHWQSTFNAIQEGLVLFDANGAVIQTNKAFDQMVASASDRGAALTADIFERLRSTGTRQTGEQDFDHKTISITMDPVFDEQRQFAGGVCILADITERKSFEQQLRHTAKLESIGVLAGGIAHDFNNLLTGILGNSSMLVDLLPVAAPEHEMAQQIMNASQSAADLTRQILAYSGKGRFFTRAVDLSAIALECRSFIRRLIRPSVSLIFETAPDLPLIQADPGQMQQLMMNLIINAGESFGDTGGGTVTVRTGVEALDEGFFRPDEARNPGVYVCVVVADTGSGMDEATQNRIFDPFFTTKFAGRGLGLSAVYGILRGHSALLRLQSRPGAGTTFRLYFPVDKQALKGLAKADRRSTARGSGTILVVDDEPAVRNFAKMALESRGYKVLVAESGEAGVEIFLQRHASLRLVLLDLTMPVMSGEEAFEHMHRVNPLVPVILSSGFSHATATERFRNKGIAGFIGKPYTGSQLDEAIESALKQGSMLDA